MTMTDLESLALLIADMNRQIRALQEENNLLRQEQQHAGTRADTDPAQHGETRVAHA